MRLFYVTMAMLLVSGFQTYGQSPGVTDMEGHVYDTIHYKGYAIMVDGLRSTKFNDGEAIPHVKNDDDWTTIAQ